VKRLSEDAQMAAAAAEAAALEAAWLQEEQELSRMQENIDLQKEELATAKAKVSAVGGGVHGCSTRGGGSIVVSLRSRWLVCTPRRSRPRPVQLTSPSQHPTTS
jgi:hypothetical protein